MRTWDVRPFAPADRRIQTYDGAPTGHERNLLKASWDSTGEKIAAGGGDQNVTIWEARTGKLLNKLPGHRGAVNDVRFHPLGEPLSKCPAVSSWRVLDVMDRRSSRLWILSSLERRPKPYKSQTWSKGASHSEGELSAVPQTSETPFQHCLLYLLKHQADLAF